MAQEQMAQEQAVQKQTAPLEGAPRQSAEATDADTWAAVIAQVRTQTKPNQFDTWFRKIACAEIRDHEVVIATPNTFYREWMSKHHEEVLAEAFRLVRGMARRPRVRFLVDATRFDNAPTNKAPKPASLSAELPTRGGRATRSAPSPAPEPASPMRAPRLQRFHLNPEYSFSNFVVGHSNRLAHAACLSVTEKPAKIYNPLFLHGDVGLGKTHLLQAVCSTLMTKDDELRIVYLSCEAFVNQYISALQKGRLEQFRDCYRHVDVLVIDDIHFLASKKVLQEEFFHTFNALYNAQRQIIISSDAQPHDIPDLENRLVSRFKWGLVAHLEPPGYETKSAIIRRKAKLRGKELQPEVVDFLASTLHSNIRELEGAVLKVVAIAGFENRAIDVALCREALKELLAETEQPNVVDISDITQCVAGHYRVKIPDLQSKKRTKSIVLPRQVCMYLGRKLTPLSLEELGGYFGGRDHSTVLYSERTVKKRLEADPDFRTTLERLEKTITGPRS